MADTPDKGSSRDTHSTLEAEGLQHLLDVTRRINAAVDLDAVLETIVDVAYASRRPGTLGTDHSGDLRNSHARLPLLTLNDDRRIGNHR